MRLLCLCLVVAVTLLALAGAEAHAARVSARVYWTSDYKTTSWYQADLTFEAAFREENRLTVTHRPVAGATGPLEGEWTFTDPGGVLEPAGSCRSVTTHEVVCTVARHEVGIFDVKLGDGADSAVVDGLEGSIRGGPGDDELRGPYLYGDEGADRLQTTGGAGLAEGGSGDDIVAGGPDDDILTGDLGHDVVTGGDGDDRIEDRDVFVAGPEIVDRDVLDGGPGHDEVSWRYHRAPLRVDLAAHSQAPASDDVTGFESVVGGSGDDRILGDAGPNRLRGEEGDDLIDGRGGDDALGGWFGDDRLLGGGGDDVLAGRGGTDRLDGGPGADRLLAASDLMADRLDCDARDTGRADFGERFAAPCPRVRRQPVRLRVAPLRSSGRNFQVEFLCPELEAVCRGTTRIAARVRGRWRRLGRYRLQRLGSEYFGYDSGLTHRVGLPAAARAELRRKRRVELRFRTVLDPGRRAGALLVRTTAVLKPR